MTCSISLCTPPRVVVTPASAARGDGHIHDGHPIVYLRLGRSVPDTIRVGLTATDANGSRAARIMTLQVRNPPTFPDEPEITLPPAIVGQSYDAGIPIPGGGIGNASVRTDT